MSKRFVTLHELLMFMLVSPGKARLKIHAGILKIIHKQKSACLSLCLNNNCIF